MLYLNEPKIIFLQKGKGKNRLKQSLAFYFLTKISKKINPPQIFP